jgi:hypothetical protein
MGGRQILWRSIFNASTTATTMAAKSPEGCFGIVGFHSLHLSLPSS